MPNKFIEGQYPIYLESGKGCYVRDDRGNSYIDYPLGLGAILLGHSYPEVNDAIREQLERGTTFTLPNKLETELAIKINKLIPCAESMRFLKTGSEATSAAIKIARAYTGKNGIAYCGYHGWHDWYTCDTPKNLGIPVDFRKYIHKFTYNDITTLERLFLEYEIGVVILEPYIYDEPKNNFLKKVIDLAHKNGAVVIFDEVVTGFRTLGYSAQKLFNAKPDLCCLGKAMANGLPLSVVCGKKEIMKVLEGDCFVSSTFGGECLSIASALATIKILEREDAIQHIWEMGEQLKYGFNFIAEDMDLDVSCEGFPCRTMFKFPTPDHKSLFWQECIKRGVLFGYAQFISFSHETWEMQQTITAVGEALKIVKENWNNPRKAIKGKPATEVFRMVCTKERNG